VILVLFLALMLLATAVSLGVRALSFSRVAREQRLDQITAYGSRAAPGNAVERRALKRRLDDVATSIGGTFDRRLGQGRVRQIRQQLSAAGLYRTTPRKFLGYRALASVASPAFWIWLTLVSGSSIVSMLFGAVCLATAGWIGPTFWLKRRAASRLTDVDHEMPELVDLLVTAVEGGLGFAGSLELAVRSLEGPLGEELRLTLQEQRMGLSMNEALQHMLGRIDTLSVRSFVQAVSQGESLGVSIGKILRDLAHEMRARRRQRAEEQAHKAGTKIIFPVALCVFPAIFVVALGPMAIYLVHTLRGG
jgi:tight adherence protein C